MHWAPIDSIYIAHASVVQKKKTHRHNCGCHRGSALYSPSECVFSLDHAQRLPTQLCDTWGQTFLSQKQTQMHVGRMLGKSKGQWQDYQVCLPWPSTKSATILEQSDPMKFQKSGHQAMRDLIILYLRPHQKNIIYNPVANGSTGHWFVWRWRKKPKPAWTSWALGSKGGASGRWQYL